MNNDKTTTIGLIVIVLIALFVGWRFIAPAVGNSGGGDVKPFVPSIQAPTIYAPVIKIDLGNDDPYKPILDKEPMLPTCGCIGNGDIGADWKTLPVFNYTPPVVQRYEPVKTGGGGIPLLGIPARKDYYVMSGSARLQNGVSSRFVTAYEATFTNFPSLDDPMPRVTPGELVWSGWVPDGAWTVGGLADFQKGMTININNKYNAGLYARPIDQQTRSFAARMGISSARYILFASQFTGSYL